MVGYAVTKAIYTFTPVTPIGAFDVSFGGIGILVTTVGLLGLYPRVRDHAPRLSLAGVVVTVVGVVTVLAVLGWLGGTTLVKAGYPAIPEEAPAWTLVAFFTAFFTIAVGFLLLGVASLRSNDLSPTIGYLLVVPGLGWIGLFVANLIPLIPPGQYLGLIAYVPISLAMLAIGYLLPNELAPAEPPELTPDSPA